MIVPLPPHPAAMVKSRGTRTLVVADLHLGWEMALSEKGIYVPTQMPKILRSLIDLVSAYKPDELLILGDIKYSVSVAEMGEWHEIPDFFDEVKRHVGKIQVIKGNHDGNLEPLLPENIDVLPASGITIGDVAFFHGHKWPSPTVLKCKTLVMGHVHPVIVFRDPAGFRIIRQVWVKAKCDGVGLARTILKKHGMRIDKNPEETLWRRSRIRVKASQLLVMPSFNDFLGGRPLNEGKGTFVGPLLHSEAVHVETAEIFLVDGTFLGRLDALRTMS